MPSIPHWADFDDAARKEYWATLALYHCKGIGARTRTQLLQCYGSSYQAISAVSKWKSDRFDERLAAEYLSDRWREGAREDWDLAKEGDFRILLWIDTNYPERLREIPDAPILLYCKGDTSLLSSPMIAIVGSRSASHKGMRYAEDMAQNLSRAGICIVSGMARGIDSSAQKAACRHVGKSIGVLGTGINTIYPKSETKFFEEFCNNGLLVSEFSPSAPAYRSNFPARNRIISGLSLGTLVIEAPLESGSLITARLALEQNREVYVIPGEAMHPQWLGSQNLIRNGAKAIFNPDDIIRDLLPQLVPFGISGKIPSVPGNERCNTPGINDLSRLAPKEEDAPQKSGVIKEQGPESQVLLVMGKNGPCTLDKLADCTEIPVTKLNSILINLEMTGQIKRLPGALFQIS